MLEVSQKWGKRFCSVVLIAAVALLVSAPRFAHAQSLISGDIAGTVTDPSGAAIPGATVTVTNTGTGLVKTVTTSGAGEYKVSLLPPGQYKVNIAAQGFQTTEQTTAVAVGQTVSVNMALAVAKGTQTVEVMGTAVPLLQPENSDLSTTITQEQVQNLPDPGGDITYFVNLTQGVVMNTQGGYGNSSAFGLPATSNNFTINGAEANDPFLNLNNSGPSNLLLGLNDIGEVNIVANAYSSQYGALGGVQENITTRAGSNKFHGNVNYLWTNSDMNANDWFNDQGHAPQAFSNANQYSAAVGGPIKKDRAFFFANYEGLRFVTAPTDVVFVPDPSYESAVIANLSSAGNAAEIPFYNKLFNLYNTAPGISRATGDSQTQWTTPSGATADWADTFVANPKNNLAEVLTTERVDLKLGANDTGFIHFKYDHGVQPTDVDPINAAFNAQSDQPDWEGQLEETHTFSPNLVNQFILSGSWYSAIFKSANQAAATAAFPYELEFFDSSFSNLGGIDIYWPQGRNATQYQVNDDLSWIHGKHSLSFGVLFKRDDITDHDLGVLTTPLGGEYGPGAAGPLDPNNDYFGMGAMLEGIENFPARATEPIATLNLGLYAQDQWKMSSNLQLTAGIRVEHNGNPACQINCFGRFPGSYNTVSGSLDTPYNTSIETGLKNAFSGLQYVAIDPRLGFTYSVPGHAHTLFRGGFGMFTDVFPGTIADDLLTNAPLNPEFAVIGYQADPAQSGSFTQALASTNAAFQTGFAANGSYNSISAADPNFAPPAMFAVDNHLSYPTYEEYSLQWEQQLGNHDSFTIGYVGNHGYHEPVQNNGVNTAQAYSGAFGGLPVNPALPSFGEIIEIESAATSNYSGLLTGIKHQSKIATATLNWTWSHAMDEISNGGILPFGGNGYYPINPFNLSQNYGNADYDLKSNLNGSYIVSVPYFGGPKLLTDRWQVGGVVFLHTGFPFSVTDSNATNTLNAVGTYGGTALAAIANSTVTHHCGRSAAAINNPCLSASSFADPTSFAQMATQRRNSFFGPGYFDTDVNVMKGFKIPGTDSGMVQVGAQAYNILNHPNFSNPTFDADSPYLGSIFSTVSTPTSVYGSFLGGDASPRILQLKADITF